MVFKDLRRKDLKTKNLKNFYKILNFVNYFMENINQH